MRPDGIRRRRAVLSVVRETFTLNSLQRNVPRELVLPVQMYYGHVMVLREG